jgi:hypothetical protein
MQGRRGALIHTHTLHRTCGELDHIRKAHSATGHTGHTGTGSHKGLGSHRDRLILQRTNAHTRPRDDRPREGGVR